MKTYIVPLILAAGLLAGCERSIEQVSQDFNALPPAVQKSIRAEAPDAEIAGISRQTEDGVETYEVTLRQEGQEARMVVAADGRIVSSDFPRRPAGQIEKLLTPTGAVGTKFSALPPEVQQAIQTHAPETEIANITRQQEDERVYYEVEFRNKDQNPTLRISENGTLLTDLQE
jgi:uncharacterized membrane protein YkoI